jgi:hypothetical protein
MESGKLVTLARRWHTTPRLCWLVLAALVIGLAVINAVGDYAQLVAAQYAKEAGTCPRPP